MSSAKALTSDISYHIGNCVDILPQLDEAPDLIITSPPYDNLRDYGGHSFDFDSVAQAIVDVMKDGSVLVWNVQDQVKNRAFTGNSFRQCVKFMDLGLNLYSPMIMEISGKMRFQYPNRYVDSWEFMFVFSKSRPKTINLIRDRYNIHAGTKHATHMVHREKDGELIAKRRSSRAIVPKLGRRTTIWNYGSGPWHDKIRREQESQLHPAVFHHSMAMDHIHSWTNEGDLVIDPMCGSGTTLRAAHRLNRRAIGIEIYDKYIPDIESGYEQSMMELRT